MHVHVHTPQAVAHGSTSAAASLSRDVAVRGRGLAGHLHKIKLENFMCHTNFELEFGCVGPG